jgi:hypothetical protein
VAALTDAARTTASLETVVASAQETSAAIRRQLQSMVESFSESRLMSLSLDQVQAQRQKVERLRSQLEQIAQKCREGSDAASLRAELVAVLDLLQKNRNEIEPWLSDIYGEFTAGVRALIERLDQEIRATGAIGAHTESIHQQIAEYETLMGRVSQRRALDADRRYTAAALEEVCKELGFAPKLLPQNGPLEDLALEVDTYAYGIIHFRLQLDGAIRSQSELVEASCCANFAMIEDRLRELGVISGFRYEGDQQPVRLRKGEKSLPGSEPGAVIRGSL